MKFSTSVNNIQMKQLFSVVIIIIAAILLFSYWYTPPATTIETTTQQVLEEPSENKLSEWQMFILALIEVESGNSLSAIGKENDCGLLQITPIYVKEANLIQKKDTFVLEDRFDIQKSLQMFNAVQNYHNKERSIKKAIGLHNPNAPSGYGIKILNKMDEIEKREEIRRHVLKFQDHK
jgi:hypothetical protein